MALALTDLTGCLDARNLAWRTLKIGAAITLIVTVVGGRVFGPFVGDEDRLGWTPDIDVMGRALDLGQWNIGGERVWLAPERAFNFTDPRRMIETYRIDPALDPGRWTLAAAADGVTLTSSLVPGRSDGGHPVPLTLTRRISRLVLADLAATGLVVAGYRQTLEVRHAPATDGLVIVPWLIRQVVLGGTALLSSARDGRGQCVFGAAPPETIIPQGGAWQVPFGTNGFFKTSFARHAVGNGRASYQMTEGGRSLALCYHPVLAAPDRYCETLPDDPFGPGQAAALFRDDGRFGSYGEVEFYGHRHGAGHGLLAVDCLVLEGPEQAVSAALLAYATEMSSIPIS